jgi:F1F0 ATPase subunit 2
MNEAFDVVLALLAGLMLGMFFFGGLWWTVRKSLSSAQPALWLLGSLLLRTLAVLAGFYFAALGGWRQLLACLGGFLVARMTVTLLTRLTLKKDRPPLPGAAP